MTGAARDLARRVREGPLERVVHGVALGPVREDDAARDAPELHDEAHHSPGVAIASSWLTASLVDVRLDESRQGAGPSAGAAWDGLF